MIPIDEYHDYQTKYKEIMKMLDDCCITDEDTPTSETSEERSHLKDENLRRVSKRRGTYDRPTNEQIWKLIHLYFNKKMTIKEAGLETNIQYSTAAGHIRKWRHKILPLWLDNYFT